MFRAKLVTCLVMAAALAGLSAPEASAFPAPASQAPAIVAAGQSPLIAVKHMGGGGGGHHGGYHGNNWNRPNNWYRHNFNHRYYGNRYYGNRCRNWNNNCRYYYNGWYYPNIWWSAPVIGLGFAINSGNYASKHVRWCSERYRSYNPRNNTWVSNSGKVRQCVSPYGG